MKVRQQRKSEQGVVSLLTVLFFMIFISLIVVAFMGLIINDQRQTTDSDLSASALDAARSGVEDGKRILLYCQANPSDPLVLANCPAILNSGTTESCDLFKGSNAGATIASVIKIPIDPATGQGATGGAFDYQQYFTCLTIQKDTPNVTATVNQGTGYIQRLATTQPFEKLTVSWSGTGTFASRANIVTWPTMSNWRSGVVPYAPVIQLQVIPYAVTDFANLDTIEQQSRTIYIAPCPLGLPGSCNIPAQNDISLLDSRGTAGEARPGSIPLKYAECKTDTTGYECSVTLTGFNGGGPALQQYYVRASVLYATSTVLKLAPSDGAGNPVLFDNVQPWIDVTGRTNDVFRRVRSKVTYSRPTALPQYVIDSAAPVCKDMTVTADGTSSTYNCN